MIYMNDETKILNANTSIFSQISLSTPECLHILKLIDEVKHDNCGFCFGIRRYCKLRLSAKKNIGRPRNGNGGDGNAER